MHWPESSSPPQRLAAAAPRHGGFRPIDRRDTLSCTAQNVNSTLDIVGWLDQTSMCSPSSSSTTKASWGSRPRATGCPPGIADGSALIRHHSTRCDRLVRQRHRAATATVGPSSAINPIRTQRGHVRRERGQLTTTSRQRAADARRRSIDGIEQIVEEIIADGGDRSCPGRGSGYSSGAREPGSGRKPCAIGRNCRAGRGGQACGLPATRQDFPARKHAHHRLGADANTRGSIAWLTAKAGAATRRRDATRGDVHRPRDQAQSGAGHVERHRPGPGRVDQGTLLLRSGGIDQRRGTGRPAVRGEAGVRE